MKLKYTKLYVRSIVLMALFRVVKSLGNADTLQNDLNVLRPLLKNTELTSIVELYDELTAYR
jgi:hypothetical protein